LLPVLRKKFVAGHSIKMVNSNKIAGLITRKKRL
jgi:hypothetical protein